MERIWNNDLNRPVLVFETEAERNAYETYVEAPKGGWTDKGSSDNGFWLY